MIVRWQDKDWLRVGECNRCGECCAFGWKNPCPHHTVNPDFTSSCRIYERRAEKNDPEAFQIAGVSTTACAVFPANPGDLIPSSIRNRCSYQFIECPKILLACSTFEGKAYCLDRWLAAVRALDYPNLDLLMVDNSDGLAYTEHLHSKGIPTHHMDVEGWPEKRITEANEYIRSYFLAGAYTWWFNLESDVIVPSNTVTLLLSHSGGGDWIGCSYRSRDKSHCVSNFGCSLFSRRIMEETRFGGIPQGHSADGYWWGHIVEPAARYRCVELYDYLDIEHA